MAVTGLLLFSLDGDGPGRVLKERELWPLAMKALGKGQVLDTGNPKPRGEFLVYGACFAPPGTRAAEVRVQVGQVERTLVVQGDRHRTLTGETDPLPFERMPVSWERAYGGPGYAANPLGKGRIKDATCHLPLPNLIPGVGLPPTKETLPVSFAAYPPGHPERTRHLGHFDAAWLRRDYPFQPEGTDPEYFMTAQPEQRLSDFLTGLERVEVDGMHPSKPRLISALPGVRMRIFANRKSAEDELFVELPSVADTVWLFPDQERGLVAFRGSCRVGSDDCADIGHLMLEPESLADDPRPLEHYHALFLKHRSQSKPAVAPPPPSPLPPEFPQPAPAGGAATSPGASPDSGPDAALDRATTAALKPSPPSALAQAAEELSASVQDDLRKAGLEPDALLGRYAIDEPVAPAGGLVKAADEISAQVSRHLAQQGLDEKTLLSRLAEQGVPPDEPFSAMVDRLAATGGLKPDAVAELKRVGVMIEGALAALEAGRAKEKPASMPQETANATAVSTEAAAATPTAETATEATEAATGTAERNDPVAALLARLAAKQSLAGVNLGGLDLSGHDLQGTDFSGALLDGAIFAKARLRGALFTDAQAQGADFSGADLSKADLSRLDAEAAHFAGARLNEAVLAGGHFSRADFSVADLSNCVLAGAVLESAKFPRATLTGAGGDKVRLRGADLSGANLVGVTLRGADFMKTNLCEALMSRAHLDEARFQGSQARRADFSEATLVKARADAGTDWSGARFVGTDLSGCKLIGAELSEASLAGAKLNGANLQRTRLCQSNLSGVDAAKVRFDGADLTQADLRRSNLFKASLRNAELQGAVLTDANLYGCDLYGAHFTLGALDGLNLRRTLLTAKP